MTAIGVRAVDTRATAARELPAAGGQGAVLGGVGPGDADGLAVRGEQRPVGGREHIADRRRAHARLGEGPAHGVRRRTAGAHARTAYQLCSPAGCFVAMLRRFQRFALAMSSTSAPSWTSSKCSA